MFNAAAMGIGALISVMLGMNAGLESAVGPIRALLVIHLAGMATVLVILAARRELPRLRSGLPWYYYGAGAMGVALTFLNIWSIRELGISLTLTLGMLGQLSASAAIDHFGLLGMERRPFRPAKIAGLALVVAGVLVMGLGKGA